MSDDLEDARTELTLVDVLLAVARSRLARGEVGRRRTVAKLIGADVLRR